MRFNLCASREYRKSRVLRNIILVFPLKGGGRVDTIGFSNVIAQKFNPLLLSLEICFSFDMQMSWIGGLRGAETKLHTSAENFQKLFSTKALTCHFRQELITQQEEATKVVG